MSKNSVSIQKKIGITILGGLYIVTQSCSHDKKDQDDSKLNILFLLADDLRWNSLGCTGNNMLVTPNIDSLAENGIRFNHAFVTTSISMVSRASILTGQYMSRHKIREFGIPISDVAFNSTYPAILKQAGYYSGFVGKYGVGPIRKEDFNFSREYEGVHWFNLGNGDSIHVTKRNTLDALEFLRNRPKDKPFVLSVSFFATHAQDNHPDQYRYQPGSEKYYRDDTIPVPETASDEYFRSLPYFLSNDANEGRIRWNWRFDTPEKYQRYMKAYYRLLTEMDIAVGEMIAELKNQGVYENTLIIFMGDNGYFHGEHGLADKWYPYEESIRIPLIIYDPRLSVKNRNAVNGEFVLNIDIAPTILSAAGIPVPEMMQGEDISKLYLSKRQIKWRKEFYYEHPFVTSEKRIPSSEALVTPSEKYIFWPFYNYEEYFDLEGDPYEKVNLIDDPEYSGRITRLKERFKELKQLAE